MLPSSKSIERWSPYLTGGGAVILWWFAWGFDKKPANFADVVNAVLAVAAVAVGFLATVKSILLTIPMPRVLRSKWFSAHRQDVIDYVIVATKLSLASCVVGLLVSLLSGEPFMPWWAETCLRYAWVVVSATAFGSCARVTTIFMEILKLHFSDQA